MLSREFGTFASSMGTIIPYGISPLGELCTLIILLIGVALCLLYKAKERKKEKKSMKGTLAAIVLSFIALAIIISVIAVIAVIIAKIALGIPLQ